MADSNTLGQNKFVGGALFTCVFDWHAKPFTGKQEDTAASSASAGGLDAQSTHLMLSVGLPVAARNGTSRAEAQEESCINPLPLVDASPNTWQTASFALDALSQSFDASGSVRATRQSTTSTTGAQDGVASPMSATQRRAGSLSQQRPSAGSALRKQAASDVFASNGGTAAAASGTAAAMRRRNVRPAVMLFAGILQHAEDGLAASSIEVAAPPRRCVVRLLFVPDAAFTVSTGTLAALGAELFALLQRLGTEDAASLRRRKTEAKKSLLNLRQQQQSSATIAPASGGSTTAEKSGPANDGGSANVANGSNDETLAIRLSDTLGSQESQLAHVAAACLSDFEQSGSSLILPSLSEVPQQHNDDSVVRNGPAATAVLSEAPHRGVVGQLCSLPVLSASCEAAAHTFSEKRGFIVTVVHPHIQRGNIFDRFSEWVQHSKPSTAEKEIVIRKIIKACLAKLAALHASGTAHGSVKATNVFSTVDVDEAMGRAAAALQPSPHLTHSRSAAGEHSLFSDTGITIDASAGANVKTSASTFALTHSMSATQQLAAVTSSSGSFKSNEWANDVVLADGYYHHIEALLDRHVAVRGADGVKTSSPVASQLHYFAAQDSEYVLPPECLQRVVGNGAAGAESLPTSASGEFTMAEALPSAPVVTPASDIWSLGLLAIHLADGGFPPWLRRQAKPVPSLAKANGWSNKFSSFVQVCVALNPASRSSAAELLHDPWFRSSIAEGTDGRNAALLLTTPAENTVASVDDEKSGAEDSSRDAAQSQIQQKTLGRTQSSHVVGGGGAAVASSRPLHHLFHESAEGRVFVPQRNYLRSFADMHMACLLQIVGFNKRVKAANASSQKRVVSATTAVETDPTAPNLSSSKRHSSLSRRKSSSRQPSNHHLRSNSSPSRRWTRDSEFPHVSLIDEMQQRSRDVCEKHHDPLPLQRDAAEEASPPPTQKSPEGIDGDSKGEPVRGDLMPPDCCTTTESDESGDDGSDGANSSSESQDSSDTCDSQELLQSLQRMSQGPTKPPFLGAFLAMMESLRRETLAEYGYAVVSSRLEDEERLVALNRGTSLTRAERHEAQLIDDRFSALVQSLLDLYNAAPICADNWIVSLLQHMRRNPHTQDLIEPVVQYWKRRGDSAGVTSKPEMPGSAAAPVGNGGGTSLQAQRDATTDATRSDPTPTEFNDYLFCKWVTLASLTLQER